MTILLSKRRLQGLTTPQNLMRSLATVTTSDGCVYQGKTIVYTPSLVVTKKMEEDGIFSPALTPGTTRSPIEVSWVLIYYRFDQSFWQQDAQYVVIGTEFQGECAMWLNYDYIGNEGNIYPESGIISCVMDQTALDNLLQRENLTELTEDFAAGLLLQPLQDTYGAAFQEPLDAIFTDWENDPTSYGSWENFPLGNDLVGYYDYFQPRNDKLFISGSGSCLWYKGYMHGAYFAGVCDAEWAIATMNGSTERPYSLCDDTRDLRQSG